ncbi:hypothetical protein B1B00_17470 [Bacillus sp. DSM 27956]|nr:hypothetical protein B1B00_17470 [Bacillus sp. DSM 27956]
MHLANMIIKKFLKDNKPVVSPDIITFPEGVEHLPLQSTIKAYLLMSKGKIIFSFQTTLFSND